MYESVMECLLHSAHKKSSACRTTPKEYFVASAIAGFYVGMGVLIMALVGTILPAAQYPWSKLVGGLSFAMALSLVVFVGAELFTGSNMVMGAAVLRKQETVGSMFRVFAFNWVGNFVGSIVIAVLFRFSGLFNEGFQKYVVYATTGKIAPSILELIIRGTFANIFVCLGVLAFYKMSTESGKLIMIMMIIYAFVSLSFEHSIANMTMFSLAVMVPDSGLSIAGMLNNLVWVTLGNIIGGFGFVALPYALTTPPKKA